MSLKQTRDGWHRIAEHVIAAAQYAETGKIGLRVTPGGFSTTRGHRQLGVVGTQLVIADDTGTHQASLTTVAAAAEFVGITPGLPADVYPAATSLVLDEPLHLDADGARALDNWYQLGDHALRRLAADAGLVQEPILWPEHFDVGITVDAVNFGASPGDDQIPQPYLYVGPHSGPPARDAFWNADFGAVRTVYEIASTDAAIRFFRAGLVRASTLWAG